MIKAVLKNKYCVLSTFAALTAASPVLCQNTLFNNGAMIYAGPSAIIHVNGGFQNDGAAGTTPVFENNGTMTIANSGTPGTVRLTNASVLQGNGTYNIEQDWINDASFIPGTSTVILYGDLQQFITSTNATFTSFNNLTLTGTGTGINRKKTLSLVSADIGLFGTLDLTDRELETQTNSINVFNPSVTAVVNNTSFGNEGFVSSAVGGRILRATNSTSSYLFPTGSSNGTLRYRPVHIKPTTASINEFTARLGNNNASADGFNVNQLDNTMCMVNDLFYHQINRASAINNADIDIFYDQITDGIWDGLAQWNTPMVSVWNDMGTVTASTSATYNDNLKPNWSDFSNTPYVLSRAKLTAPVFVCNDVCANSTGNIFTASGAPAGSSYVWSTPAGTTITSGNGTNTINVDWNASSGQIIVLDTNSAGCFSDPVFCTVNVSSPPSAAFDTTSSGFSYNFIDLSTGGASAWTWDFGDGSSSTQQNPTHGYSANGLQTVCLTAINTTGCADTSCMTIAVDALDYINIPNVFTPDNDGINDVFYINSAGLKEFQLDVYNRWGTLLFTSTDSKIKWDGRSSTGVELSDGTYFFILKAVSVTSKDYSTRGFVTLLRSGQ
ncbi:MAG: domain containing protein [Bacteroidetes bacterium]|jgi:gliding motility-associated-like protein|nr:domain containing protein [Bacteroidota bacterium]